MARSTPTSIITYLDTNWVTATISKPDFVNQFENEQIKSGHALAVNWGGMTWEPEARVKDTEYNTINIEIVETSLANLILVIDMVRPLLRNKTLTGGHYMVTAGNPMKVGNHYLCFLTLEEVMYAQ